MCTQPVTCWRFPGVDKLIFSPKWKAHADAQGLPYEELAVPCRYCRECRENRAAEWGVRVEHERQLHGPKCFFVTLTYDDEHLPFCGVLVPRDLMLFLKRLRRHLEPVEVRFLASGEYGGQTGRPHFHAVVFGWWPDDARAWSKSKGHQLFRSAELEVLWPFGTALFGRVTDVTGAYVAKYATKGADVDDWPRTQPVTRHCPLVLMPSGRLGPVFHPDTGEVLEWVPPFIRMSRRPGLGAGWFERFPRDALRDGRVRTRSGACRSMPRYYEKLETRRAQAEGDEVSFDIERIKAQRAEYAQGETYQANNTPHMRRMRNVCKVAAHLRGTGRDKL